MNSPTIRELYPDLTDEELAEAEDAIDQYLAVVIRIYERLEEERLDEISEKKRTVE